MFSKTMSRCAVSVLGLVFVMSLCIGLPPAIAEEEPEPCEGSGCIYGCPDDDLFTQEFNLQDCGGFKTYGANPYFSLKPGYRSIYEGVENEDTDDPTWVREEVTVLCDTKWIKLNGSWIKTRVVEERAIECEDENYEECETVEISFNWFAICKRTNAVYYFGEDSRTCDDGFSPGSKTHCDDGELADDEGSWEAGEDGEPGLIMPGTPLMGAKYFQEIAPPGAVDRGQVVDVGKEYDGWDNCIEIHDTNPAEAIEGGCIGEEDVKIYCHGVGLVSDQELELVPSESGYVGCDGDDGDDHDWSWMYRHHRSWH